jgi:hypothetical protein
MGNTHTQTDQFKEHLRQNGFSHTAAGRHTTGHFLKTKNIILKENKKETALFSDIFQKVFPQPDKLRNTLNTGFRRSKQNLSSDNEREKTKSFDIGRPRDEEKNNEYSNYFTEIDNDISKKDKGLRKSLEYELNIKTADDIRKSYIAKLIFKNIWQPTTEVKKHNSIIIFDWDDTLLPTTFLTPNGVFSEDCLVDSGDLTKIKNLEKSVLKILQLASNKADTYIITNAAPGWVEYSTKRFYPQIAGVLKDINIVSARGEFEKIHPGDSRQWKIKAFLNMLQNIDTSLITNLICLGDSIIEMEAAHVLASNFGQAFIKTIKFRESPKPEELHKQLNLVIDQFDKIFSAIKNLTIKVDRKSKTKD